MPGDSLTIGQVAAQAGVNVQTLRYYERRGLLKTPYRRDTGYRQYPSDAVAFIRAIKQAQSLGFTLAEIEEIVAITERRPDASTETLAASAAQKITEIDGKLADLAAIRRRLELVIDQRCNSLTSCTCGAGCALTEQAQSESAPDVASAHTLIERVTAAPARGKLGLVLAAAVACGACLLPAVFAGALGIGGLSVLSSPGFGGDLPLAAGSAALGAAAVFGGFAIRGRLGKPPKC